MIYGAILKHNKAFDPLIQPKIRMRKQIQRQGNLSNIRDWGNPRTTISNKLIQEEHKSLCIFIFGNILNTDSSCKVCICYNFGKLTQSD